MKTRSRVVALLLSLLMVQGALAGCGSPADSSNAGDVAEAPASETDSTAAEDSTAQGDMVTLSLFIPALAPFTDDATRQVEAALNEYLAPEYGIQIDLRNIEFGNFATTINLGMTTDEVDLTCYFPGNGNLTNYAVNNQLLDITDMFNNAPAEFKDLFSDAEMIACSYNGSIYGTPRKFPYGGARLALMNKDIVDELGIDPESITDNESLEVVLYQVKEAYPDVIPLVPQSSMAGSANGGNFTWHRPWVDALSTSNAFKLEDADSTELKSVFELDDFREFAEYTHRWYQDGLIMGDVLSNTMEGGFLVSQGAAFASLVNGDDTPLDTIYPNTVTSALHTEPIVGPADISNIQYGISANSAHPEKAFELLQALYLDAELATLLAYGIEGTHYVTNEAGRVDYPDGLTGDNHPYGGFVNPSIYPYSIILPLKVDSPRTDAVKEMDEWNARVNPAETIGFFFDMGDYVDFSAAYNNLEDKYLGAIFAGVVALDDVLPEIQAELESIGYYELQAEIQAELDAWLAAQ